MQGQATIERPPLAPPQPDIYLSVASQKPMVDSISAGVLSSCFMVCCLWLMVNRDRPGSRAPVERVNLDDDRVKRQEPRV